MADVSRGEVTIVTRLTPTEALSGSDAIIIDCKDTQRCKLNDIKYVVHVVLRNVTFAGESQFLL